MCSAKVGVLAAAGAAACASPKEVAGLGDGPVPSCGSAGGRDPALYERELDLQAMAMDLDEVVQPLKAIRETAD